MRYLLQYHSGLQTRNVSNSSNCSFFHTYLAIPGFPQSDHTISKVSADSDSLWNTVNQTSWTQVILKTQLPIFLDYRARSRPQLAMLWFLVRQRFFFFRPSCTFSFHWRSVTIVNEVVDMAGIPCNRRPCHYNGVKQFMKNILFYWVQYTYCTRAIIKLLLIRSRSWIQAINKDRIFWKNLFQNKEMFLEMG